MRQCGLMHSLGDGIDGTADDFGGIGALHQSDDGHPGDEGADLEGAEADGARQMVQGIRRREIHQQDQYQLGNRAYHRRIAGEQIPGDGATRDLARSARHADHQANQIAARRYLQR